MKNSLLFFLFFLFILGIIFSIFIFGKNFRNYSTEYIQFENDRGDKVRGILYFPADKGEKKMGGFPAIISIHYGLQNREALQPAAKMTAENGIIALDLILKKSRNVDGKTKDFQDYLSDARGAIDFLAKHECVDRDKIFISGHSIGANIAAMVGDGNKDAAGVVAVGYPVTFSDNAAQDLLVTSGIFDELHPYAKMNAAFRETLGDETNNSVLINPDDIEDNIAPSKPDRLYLVSFLSDHYVEPTDPVIAKGSVAFIRAVTREPSKRAPEEGKILDQTYNEFIRVILARIFLFLSVFFTYSFGFVSIMGKKAPLPNIPAMIRERLTVILMIAFIVIIGFIHKPTEHIIDIYILSPMLLSIIAFHHFRRKLKEREINPEESGDRLMGIFSRDVAKILVYIGIFYFAYLVGLFFNAGLYPISKPSHVLRTVPGVLYLLTSQFFVFCSRINGFFLKEDWSFNFGSILMWGILLVELAYPGAIGLIIDNFFSRIIKTLQNLEFKIKMKINLPGVILLVVVIIVNIIFWRQIIAEGYSLGSKEMLGLVKLLMSFIILPAIIVITLLRWGKMRSLVDLLKTGGAKENE